MDAPRSNVPVPTNPMWHVRHVVETGSTNVDLLASAATGAPHGTVLVTDHQTAGRGRLDRRWDAPPGSNLLVSVLFRRGFDPANPHQLTQRVAVAAAEAIEACTDRRPTLKWPNDLLLDGAKLAGILAQAGTVDGRVDHVVVGMGCNLRWAPPGAATLPDVDRDVLLAAWLNRLARRFEQPIGEVYRARLSTIGQRVRVERTTGDLIGVAVGVTDAGELLVDEMSDAGGDAVRHVIAVGDVIHLRAAD